MRIRRGWGETETAQLFTVLDSATTTTNAIYITPPYLSLGRIFKDMGSVGGGQAKGETLRLPFISFGPRNPLICPLHFFRKFDPAIRFRPITSWEEVGPLNPLLAHHILRRSWTTQSSSCPSHLEKKLGPAILFLLLTSCEEVGPRNPLLSPHILRRSWAPQSSSCPSHLVRKLGHTILFLHITSWEEVGPRKPLFSSMKLKVIRSVLLFIYFVTLNT